MNHSSTHNYTQTHKQTIWSKYDENKMKKSAKKIVEIKMG